MKTAQVVLVLWGCLLGMVASAAMVQEKTFPTSGIRTVMVEHAAGDVEIIAGAPEVMSVQVAQLPGNAVCATSTEKVGSTFEIRTRAVGAVPGKCSVDLRLTIPKTMAIEATIGAGNVDLRNIAGKLTLSLGVGSITGNVDLKTAKITLGDGPLALSWNSMPARGDLDLKVARGDVTLSFPKGSAISTTLTPTPAPISSQVSIDANAPFKVTGTVGAGSIAFR